MSAIVTFYWSPRAWGDLRLRVSAFSPEAIAVISDRVIESAPSPLVTIRGIQSMRSAGFRAFRRERLNSGASVMTREPTSHTISFYFMRAFFSENDPRVATVRTGDPSQADREEMRRVHAELWPALSALVHPKGSAALVHWSPAFLSAVHIEETVAS